MSLIVLDNGFRLPDRESYKRYILKKNSWCMITLKIGA